jgi:hypothetical protein
MMFFMVAVGGSCSMLDHSMRNRYLSGRDLEPGEGTGYICYVESALYCRQRLV